MEIRMPGNFDADSAWLAKFNRVERLAEVNTRANREQFCGLARIYAFRASAATSKRSARRKFDSRRNPMKSRRSVAFVLSALAALAVAVPMMARNASAKNSKGTTATMEVLSTATIGGKEIKPGTYTFQADESTLTVLRGGKMVAEVPVQWKDETNKPNDSNIVVQNNAIKEVHFGGKMKYVEVME
jgi:hypothetical protein